MTYVVDHGGAACWLGLAGRWPADLPHTGGSMARDLLLVVTDTSWLLRRPSPPSHVRQDVELVSNAFELFPAIALWPRALELRSDLESIEPALSLALAEWLDVPLITLDASLQDRFPRRVIRAS